MRRTTRTTAAIAVLAAGLAATSIAYAQDIGKKSGANDRR